MEDGFLLLDSLLAALNFADDFLIDFVVARDYYDLVRELDYDDEDYAAGVEEPERVEAFVDGRSGGDVRAGLQVLLAAG